MKKSSRAVHPSSQLRIEEERAGYIEGQTREERKLHISRIWDHIKSGREHYRAPGHHPVSSPEIIHSTALPSIRSELHIDHKPNRHILYMDTLDLLLNSCGIQVRLEVKQKQKKGVLSEKFREVTIKIGDKAEQRIEEAVRVSFHIWKKNGFFKALYAGMEAEIKRELRENGKEEAQELRAKLGLLKKAMRDAVKRIPSVKLENLKVFPLVHLNRDTIETEYSPYDHKGTIIEAKTDDCSWETVLRTLTGEFAQFEAEHIKGDPNFYRREFDSLASKPDFGIILTTDSKEQAAFAALSSYLLPKNDEPEEIKRAERNRQALMPYLKPYEFVSLSPDDFGLHPSPF